GPVRILRDIHLRLLGRPAGPNPLPWLGGCIEAPRIAAGLACKSEGVRACPPRRGRDHAPPVPVERIGGASRLVGSRGRGPCPPLRCVAAVGPVPRRHGG